MVEYLGQFPPHMCSLHNLLIDLEQSWTPVGQGGNLFPTPFLDIPYDPGDINCILWKIYTLYLYRMSTRRWFLSLNIHDLAPQNSRKEFRLIKTGWHFNDLILNQITMILFLKKVKSLEIGCKCSSPEQHNWVSWPGWSCFQFKFRHFWCVHYYLFSNGYYSTFHSVSVDWTQSNE